MTKIKHCLQFIFKRNLIMIVGNVNWHSLEFQKIRQHTISKFSYTSLGPKQIVLNLVQLSYRSKNLRKPVFPLLAWSPLKMCKQPFFKKENIRFFKTRQLFLLTTSLTLIYPGYSPFFNYLLFNYISILNASWPHNRMTQSTILIFPISSTSLGGGCPG